MLGPQKLSYYAVIAGRTDGRPDVGTIGRLAGQVDVWADNLTDAQMLGRKVPPRYWNKLAVTHGLQPPE